ncbi:hypothetical protein [Halalkalibacter okhensis]|uniref:Uncharacterized protein n=1 Tax=Halalkalibacter okhensis TaxID=333138 RepID=A0A0B0I6S9_9BACI|nr:hypothetical protein [Halalkalibacter okhensis]KHF38178.1 hypothetical protein LQ50_22760 [Halalkalibacter okhensis]
MYDKRDVNISKNNHSVTFYGEIKDWKVEYRMYLIETEAEIEPKIIYTGNDAKVLQASLRYEIEDNKDGLISEAFKLDNKGVYQGKQKTCFGCYYLNKVKEIECTIGREDGETIAVIPLRQQL